ncbi:hypothetical protein QE250_12245 [Chromatiaceae bacterium AAb-1]|nr:hypothetical protein [Chromatiaceae bacterium AAb-1]
MSEKKTNSDAPSSKLGLTAEEAAAASVAQSIALAAQNEVDALRNQNTVNMVAMGVAYAKWLQNPVMGEHFSGLVNTTRLSYGSEEQPVAKAFGGKPVAAAHTAVNTLPAQIFNYFLSPPDVSE